MRLLKFRISAYKSIVEAVLNVDPQITVLVGANEGGKTNVLRALEGFTDDLSGDQVCQFAPAYQEGLFPELQALFSLDAGEAELFLRSVNIIENGLPPTDDSEEGEAELEPETPTPKVHSHDVERFTQVQTLTITKQGNDANDYFLHLDDHELKFSDPKKEREFKTEFLENIPRFLYFEDLGLLKGEVPLSKLLSEDRAYQTERNFLNLGGISNLKVLQGDPKRRDVAILNAAKRVTDRLRKYWTQDPTRQFHINIDRDVLRITLSDSTGVFDAPEDRSLGSRWFMSFYINFAARISSEAENAILLFDEPGIHVHPRGQRDLLPFIEELASNRQIIYTTHLPFLINRNFPSRIRVVEKKGAEGTVINNKPHENRWKAIRSAVGLLASDSFIVGDTCLVVEGVSDHVFVAALSRLFAELGLPHLDMNEVAIIPAPSASEAVAPARFCQAEKIPVVVLLDSDNQGDQAKDVLLRDRFINESQVIRINQAFPTDDGKKRAIEDLLPAAEYMQAVNSFYARQLGNVFKPLALDELRSQTGENAAELPIASALSKVFGERKYGGFDKRGVAEEFVNNLASAEALIGADVVKLRAEFEPFSRLCLLIGDVLKKLSKENQA